MKRRVVVTGIGTITPIGNNVKTFWDGCLAGKSGIGPITSIDPTHFDSKIAGHVKDFRVEEYLSFKDAKHTEPFVHFAIAASKEAILDSKLNIEQEDKNRIGVLIGSGIGSLGIIERQYGQYLEKGPSRINPFLIPMLIVNEASGQVSINFDLRGPNMCVTTACASGTHSIGQAFRLIQYGETDIMVTGGTESCVTHLGVGGFCALKALSTRNDEPQKASRPFDAKRNGFVIAEGCGIVVLEDLEHALKRNAHIYAEICGYGMSGDAYHATAPDPEGDGACRSMLCALKDANLKPQDISYINAHGTSTLLNDKIETLAIKKSFGDHAKKLAVNSTKSMTGHLLGAAGAVEFVVCCLSIKNDIVHPTINYEFPDPQCDLDYVPNSARKMKVESALSNSLGFGGHNATLIAKKFNQ